MGGDRGRGQKREFKTATWTAVFLDLFLHEQDPPASDIQMQWRIYVIQFRGDAPRIQILSL